MRLLALFSICALVFCASCGGSDLGMGCPGSDPAPPDVTGTWVVSDPEIVSSTCSSSINDQLLALIGGPDGSCDYDMSQDVNNVSAIECHGARMTGCVDGSGNIRGNIYLTSITSNCTIQANSVLNADSSETESSAEYTMTVTFQGSGCGVLTDCEAVIGTAWDLD